jgi:pilus assembly protein CpaB
VGFRVWQRSAAVGPAPLTEQFSGARGAGKTTILWQLVLQREQMNATICPDRHCARRKTVKLTPWMLTVAAFLIIAVLAVGFIIKKLGAQEIVRPPEPQSRTLPMAITDIEPGTMITRAHIGNGPWRAAAELEPDTMTSADGVVGRVAKERIAAAQPLRGSQFYAPGEYPDLDVAAGMRAVTVDVGDNTAMVNGLIKPGQYVDVHLTVSQSVSGQGSRDEAMTVTLFEGVRVVAMNRSYTPVSNSERSNVTLELNKQQARVLLLSSQRGTIALTFNPEGPGEAGLSLNSDGDRVTMNQILGIEDVADPEGPFQTENYRGSGRTTLYFDNDRRVPGSGDDVGGGGVPIRSNGASSDRMSNTDQPTDAATTRVSSN